MTASEDLAAAAAHIFALRDAVASLQAHVGETVDVTRLKDDVARLRADLTLVARACGVADAPEGPQDKVYIPEGDYDPSFWQDADDEGLGAIGRKG
jgi:hypothetical protein